jgi:hypothetical protein
MKSQIKTNNVSLELISQIKRYLFEEKKQNVSELAQLENYLADPSDKSIKGSLSLVFSAVKHFKNGNTAELTEAIDFSNDHLQISTTWNEENYSEKLIRADYKIAEKNPCGFINYLATYSWNAIHNILAVDKGTFEIITDQFAIEERK